MMRAVNVPMRVVLGLPFATPLSGRLMLALLTGRRTGRSYRQPGHDLAVFRRGQVEAESAGGPAEHIRLTRAWRARAAGAGG
jgi:hypothetical protein